MNPAFDEVLSAGTEAMLSAFDTTAARLGTTSQNIEKDFWVCWTLDALFHGLPEASPRLLFKGGTSLSKGFGLINRFSEDVDITVFRDDIDAPATVAELEALSGKKRKARLDAIRDACQAYIAGPMREVLSQTLSNRLTSSGLNPNGARIELDDTDPDGQTLLVWYPATTPHSDYVRAAIKIEAGAKSALDPNREVPIKPYVDDDLPALDLTVPSVRTVKPKRTFWDKVVILHELRRWFDKRGELRGGGQRVSRHYYDLHLLAQVLVGMEAAADVDLGADCVAHARMFFNRPDFDLASAAPGSFALTPHDGMVDQLRTDYRAMRGMIFGEPPAFDDVLASVAAIEQKLNQTPLGHSPARRNY
ncbi:nucleotidyl transferase AbiEii/AbiGii toxin family protein [Bradyrhizobium sp. CCBAU 51753]|uniref:nucleotidyl transferase AbiEii/AbiGii toxin family protein n=1 Tax=Bradyrhizobium sp. CCBAU 51753 TaxID=1325100 RepID=UPI00188A9D27|nr:nucleotidyl transferase AbiEii/AbiGii toxin family protein [Bradyrhizobium sp. CCBAU 51753]QOZ24054.1 nucleotidyl transferase AbiEii/AbiGii toxin family protein [Bradyrhizobium sp. CCBAU 51753]